MGRVKSLSLFQGLSYLRHYAWGDASRFRHYRTIRTVQEAVLSRDVNRVRQILNNCKNKQVGILRFNQINIWLGVMFALVYIERCNSDEIRFYQTNDGWVVIAMELMDELSWQWSIIICFLLFLSCIYIVSNILVNTNDSNIILFVSVNICSVCLYIMVISSCTCVKCSPICTCVFVHVCIFFVIVHVYICVLFVQVCPFQFYLCMYTCRLVFTCVYFSPFLYICNCLFYLYIW